MGNKPARAPCMGAFSCCAANHVVHKGPIPRRIPCDKKEISVVLNRMFNAKVFHQFEVARSMCYIMSGLEHTVYSGADRYSELLLPSVMRSTEGETIEQFAAKVGLESLNDRGEADQDLLQIAVRMHDLAAVRSLLALRCSGSPWHRNAVGNSAFDIAVFCANVESARAFLATGEIGDDHITVPNVLGGTTLQAAAENGHLELVQLLLDHRAEVDFPKSPHSKYAGRTALHGASMNCWDECCKLLLQHLACAQREDAKGCTPLDLAVREVPDVIGNQAPDARARTMLLLLEATASSNDDP